MIGLRARIGYTQVRFAALLGVHEMTVSRWERGTLQPTTRDERILSAISDALMLSPDGLPQALRTMSPDPIQELTAILSTLHPEVAYQAVRSRADAEALLIAQSPDMPIQLSNVTKNGVSNVHD